MLALLTAGVLIPQADFRPYAKPLKGEEWSGAIEAPKELSWTTALTDDKEKGEPLIVTGTIYKPDGKTPAPGVCLYVYQTDSEGLYSRGSGNGNGSRHGKLRGWMRTGIDGRYEFRTVKPGPYPGGGNPAHIHATLTGDKIEENYIEDFLFEGDQFLPNGAAELNRRQGRFNPILRLAKDAKGVWRANRDLKLKGTDHEMRPEQAANVSTN